MISHPSSSLEIMASDQFAASGPLSDELAEWTGRWARYYQLEHLPACHVTLRESLPRHVGLGSGTQLISSLMAGLNAFEQHPPFSPLELARVTGRGKRSAVGTYGFLYGGLIVESGKLPHEQLAPLEQRLDFPSPWRFVLVQVGCREGLFGHAERRAFERLPPVSPLVRENLIQEVWETMIPALQAHDCQAVGESLYRYGRTAGMCFASVQGGPYNGARLTALVEEIRGMGVHGVGQSSWGPMLFCLVPDQTTAEHVQAELSRRHADEGVRTWVTSAENQGAEITVAES